MEIKQERNPSVSYFWSCLTLDENCPYFNKNDPKLFYLSLAILLLYFLIMLVFFGDAKLWLYLDRMQKQIYEYINVLKTKIRISHPERDGTSNIQEQLQRELYRSRQSVQVTNAVLTALDDEKSDLLSEFLGENVIET